VGIPDIDYTHLPDPMAEALKCLVDRIIALEQELDEINPERKSRRREKITRSQETLDRLLHFRDGGGI
jgi:transposase